jgi:uncharacterized protein (TIGR02001 family)
MKLSHGLAAIVLTMSAAAAHAEITGTVTAVSDYDFRGFTQTSKNPAIQGSLDYSHASGFYAGVWGSNIDFGNDFYDGANVEVDLYAGFRGGDAVTYDVGLIYYTYPGAETTFGGDSLNFGEIYGSLGWKWLSGKIWYSNDFGNSGDSAQYYEGNVSVPLPANFGLTAHVGYSDGSYWSGGGEYTDYSVGLTYAIGNFTLGLKYVDGSDAKDLDDFCKGTEGLLECKDKDVFSTDARAIFSVSTTFPWAKKE